MTAKASTPAKIWIGRVLSALPVLMMTLSASMKLSHAPQFMAAWTPKFGWPASSASSVAAIELSCVALYLFPRTSVLGAILVSSYLGGATATHMRVGEAVVAPVAVGVLAWLGLYLREERLHALLPFRKV